MIEDFHGAAHNCLSAYAGASEQIGEFTSLLDQAEKQMRAAEDVVNNVLAQASGLADQLAGFRGAAEAWFVLCGLCD